MSTDIPTVDLQEWRHADLDRLDEIAWAVDLALRETGMFLLTGHDVPRSSGEDLRDAGLSFFRLPRETKLRYEIQGQYDNGWREVHRNVGIPDAAANDDDSAPDLHESFYAGPTHRTGDARADGLFYPANRWPAELPRLRAAADAYTAHMVRVAEQVNSLLADVLELPRDFFNSLSRKATWTQNVSWYPSLARLGQTGTGRMRNAPHTDLGTFTLLNRQPGKGGLEVWNEAEGWFPPVYARDSDTLIVILGDLMELWTDGRWRALRHRVPAPRVDAGEEDEEQVSLVFFFEADPQALIEPLPAPVGGGRGMAPAVAGESILGKLGVPLTPA
ncbi:2-oxoglutarate and iron-dependent oxygenase domain-containing protein [Actinacidiphila sp. ITFR-21]|uniref:2-oxoglutarate and iron-dependent oxygenase domain-containing protein n=1 Tax=Actinacidiphila sp. ITFR-21 TaxID=3075199 RepID=UPI002889695C|nr:2-oxoglutarate and iron-dependent oxygenase domain-containing protein [Streptomyces sp. ITFR-21]WNI16409.1 2-oxoglutarate and iron-dependent oxygenase domain-containing protein [Streptomyces sp. ITFR-21]